MALHKDLKLMKSGEVRCRKCNKALTTPSLSDAFSGTSRCPSCGNAYSHEDTDKRTYKH